MPTVSFTLPITPESQKRPRHSARHGFVRMHKKPSDIANEAAIAALAAPYKPPYPITTAVSVSFVAVMPRPKALCTVSKRTNLPLNDTAGYAHTARPDVDNLAKGLLDALKSWWCDDSQVYCLSGKKMVAAYGEQPHWDVTVSW